LTWVKEPKAPFKPGQFAAKTTLTDRLNLLEAELANWKTEVDSRLDVMDDNFVQVGIQNTALWSRLENPEEPVVEEPIEVPPPTPRKPAQRRKS
jgi:hypothetical protein